ncbi:MAG TPA: hypothetical protein VNF73_11795 [Candidatus Saccharimonadales bacterium]|nr:hypothetical protein [Candidatus Saccharimonadales bacterium]
MLPGETFGDDHRRASRHCESADRRRIVYDVIVVQNEKMSATIEVLPQQRRPVAHDLDLERVDLGQAISAGSTGCRMVPPLTHTHLLFWATMT